jgi:hypothetical protein
VTKLHKAHFDLLVTFDDQSYIPERRLFDIPSFEEMKQESSMLKYLKVSAYLKNRSGVNDKFSIIKFILLAYMYRPPFRMAEYALMT